MLLPPIFRNLVTRPYVLFFVLTGTISTSLAQNGKGQLSIQIKDNYTAQGLPAATIKVNGIPYLADNAGKLVLNSHTGAIKLQLSQVGYLPKDTTIRGLDGKDFIVIRLLSKRQQLQEVVVTGRESNGIYSSTHISRDAMKLLQPTSFTDLLELLPGGVSKDPNLTAANTIRIRETGINAPGYDIGSLGVSFLVDGRPISTQANLQETELIGPVNGALIRSKSRNTMSRGVDMRSLSTDNIQNVEIIRGIPSVQYGNLTSGLVKITRKADKSPLSLRFKADGLSKLFYMGKGMELADKTFLNIGVDYLRGKSDPTVPFENFNRFTAMFKLDKQWQRPSNTIEWSITTDLSSNLDRDKKDNDIGYAAVDRYSGSNRMVSIANNLRWTRTDKKWFRTIELMQSASMESNQVNQTKWVQLANPVAIANALDEGAHDGIYLPGQYTGQLKIDGKPVNSYLKIVAEHQLNSLGIQHTWLTGAEWSYDRNLGEGYIYDTQLPPVPNMSLRPRKFSAIPANQELSAFIEDHLQGQIGSHRLELAVGIRTNKLLGLSDVYTELGRWFMDPRINLQWSLPQQQLWNNPFVMSIGAGWGRTTRKPVMSQIYPDDIYRDFVQLNYYNENPDYRRVNLMTYRRATVNPAIQPTYATKREIRMNMYYAKSSLYLTFFDERMENGFRNMNQYEALQFNRFDIASIPKNTFPDITTLPYTLEKQFVAYPKTFNGSSVHKKGIEFQILTPRFSLFNTRLTADGAWFDSQYRNSMPVYQPMGKEIILDGKKQQYIGLYHTDDGYSQQNFTSKLTIDNYLPDLGMSFMTSFQFSWFAKNKNTPKNGMPISYIGIDGIELPYTTASLQDPVLQHLLIRYNDSMFLQSKTPMRMNINLKATKNIGKKIRLAMFVNRLLQYNKSYQSNGIEFRSRGLNSPYFGMELNVNI